jgi:hypothetical protein
MRSSHIRRPRPPLDHLGDVVGVELVCPCEDGVEVGHLPLAREGVSHGANLPTDGIVSDLVVCADQLKGFSLSVDVSLITPVSLRSAHRPPPRRKPWRHLLEEMRGRSF